MSIQRYVAGFAPNMAPALLKCADGDTVLFTDHLAELHNLLSTLADIRAALGVGEKPMLSELVGIVRTRMGVIKILERDAKVHAAEVERLTGERDALKAELETIKSSPRPLWPDDDPMIVRMSMERDSLRAEREELVKELSRVEQGFSREASYSEKLKAERDAAVLERDAAVEALKVALRNIQHGEYESQKRGWPRMIEVLEMGNAALAKIEGGRG